jgi:nucleotide-binding universal stress UspA family protein
MVETNASSTGPIVVAINFDQPSVYALRRAAEIFRRSPASELDILHVVERLVGSSREDESASDGVPERVLDFVSTHLGDPSTITRRNVGIHVRYGDPAVEILRFAEDVGVQLVVVGSHGRSGVAKKLLGSTSERVLELSRAPVVVASGDPASEAPAIQPPCAACKAARVLFNGRRWWCPRHSEHHARAHSYSYRCEWPSELHDSEVIPTGVDIA